MKLGRESRWLSLRRGGARDFSALDGSAMETRFLVGEDMVGLFYYLFEGN